MWSLTNVQIVLKFDTMHDQTEDRILEELELRISVY